MRKISGIFMRNMLHRYVNFSTTENDVNMTKQRFLHQYNFPDIIGAIDCTHVAIVAPNENREAYLNRKGYYSINVQAICDSNMKFMNVNSRYPGSTHDSAIWEVSTINEHLRQRFENGAHNFWLIGDIRATRFSLGL